MTWDVTRSESQTNGKYEDQSKCILTAENNVVLGIKTYQNENVQQ